MFLPSTLPADKQGQLVQGFSVPLSEALPLEHGSTVAITQMDSSDTHVPDVPQGGFHGPPPPARASLKSVLRGGTHQPLCCLQLGGLGGAHGAAGARPARG